MQNSHNNNQKEKNNDSEEDIIHANSNVELVSRQMTQFNRLVDAFQDFSSQALDLGRHYVQEKLEIEKSQQIYADKQHHRGVITIIILVGVIFILCMTALIMRENEILQIILQSSLAIAAGAGLANLLRRKRKETSKCYVSA